MTKLLELTSTRTPGLAALRLLTLAALTLTQTNNAALADDGVPVEGILAVDFTASQTSPGIIAISANGVGMLTNVGNLSLSPGYSGMLYGSARSCPCLAYARRSRGRSRYM
jgi:hypothetical protein